MSNEILAIDAGGSKIVAGTADGEGNILCSEKTPLPDGYDADGMIAAIIAAARKFLDRGPRACGIAIPGLADPARGIWKYSPFSQIADLPVARIVSDAVGLPVFIENDVNACALAERRFGACRDADSFMWVTLSNGVGGAIYLNGRLYNGETGNAGEIGHFIVEENGGFRCGCGRHGCLEAMASGRGISNAYLRDTGESRTAAEIADLARAGDAAARKAFDEAGGYVGKALSYCVNLLNIKTVVIGGGVSESFDLLEEPIRSALAARVFSQATSGVEVRRTALGYYAALVGAAAIAM